MDQFGGWSSMMVPTTNPTAQDQFQQQQQFQMQRQQQQQFQIQQQQHQFQMQQQQQQQQQFQMQQQQQSPQQQQQPPQQQPPQQQQQSLASHFHIINVTPLKHHLEPHPRNFCLLIESLAKALQSGTRDQSLDALVNELTNQLDKCQKLLNTISSSLDNKGVTVEGQKHKLEEAEQLLHQRRELIAKYRSSVEDLLNSDGNI